MRRPSCRPLCFVAISTMTLGLTALVGQDAPAKKDVAPAKNAATKPPAPKGKPATESRSRLGGEGRVEGQAAKPAAKTEPAKQPIKPNPSSVPRGEPIQDLSAAAKKLDPLAGHSAHGEAFNDGPRQRAYLMGGTGRVNLTVTTKSPEAQKFFNQGIGQLHGFWTYEAERSFRQAAALDPECAMAYWGMALANFGNDKRGKGFLAEAVKRRGQASRREQMWIDSLSTYFNTQGDGKARRKAFVERLDNLAIEFPDELEAKAFLAWAIWDANRHGQAFDSHTSLDSIIGQVLAREPLHPVHHYRIHLWDYKKAELALQSAALCGPSAPTIAHMWHMPGHIYWRLARYHDSAYQQEASARADHAQMMRDHVLPYQIGNYAHNNEWCCRSLINIGRVHDAIELATNMIEQPRHPSLNTITNGGSSAHYGRARLFEVLHRYELWDEAIAACEGTHLDPTDQFDEQVKRLRMLGRAYLGKGEVAKAKPFIADLAQRLADVKAQQDTAGKEAEDKARAARKPAQPKDADAKSKDTKQPERKEPNAKEPNAKQPNAKQPDTKPKDGKQPETDEQKFERELSKTRDNARRPFDGKVAQLTQALDELNGRLAFIEGRQDEGLRLLEKANGMPKEHLAVFHSLAGKHDKAMQLAKQAKDGNKNEVHPLAVYVDVLYRAGKKDDARKAFEELRAISEVIDLDVPAMQRLAPIAKEFGWPADWRHPRETPGDLGQRPALASLGPFRWEPAKAEQWNLPTGDGRSVSLADYRGKPVIVIFYLGYGCLHCAQQIEKFAPKADEFRKAGIELVAVSSDTTADLEKSIKKYQAEKTPPRPFPMPLVADPELRVFREYRAYDDFERSPLHGTFLIDGQGLIRWQDIGPEPFMEADFLLSEAQRLLKQPPRRAGGVSPLIGRRGQ